MVAEIDKLDRLIAFLAAKRGRPVSLPEVIELGGVVNGALHDFYGSLHVNLHRQLKEISDFIVRIRTEIGALRPQELHQVQIPSAENELTAVVKAAECATNDIMERAEAVLAANPDDVAAYRDFVRARMLEVIEACSFQDITGQRVAKVVAMLEQIEARMARFAAATRIDELDGPASADESAAAERRARLLLHGPAPADAAPSQATIDFLLNSKQATVTQAEIDSLFDRPPTRRAG